ncbi:gluconolactonase [candidate division KSB3 bacterium]|uniref:Gluconolactonase n=1 Tax=candidate division KSB3 bacterium TaxID=2044937 RepID=A0A2G6E4E4_9BACT|nr:MAG: gluconolactonase [candidate division KSB3 bacterium]PIE29353.1 MAG: gluconolactonase [candidate division KSB3 bacterium]
MKTYQQRDWNDPVVRYPDPAIEVLDPRFQKYAIGSAALERLYTGTRWGEGPVWFGDSRCLIWSDIPNNRMLRWLEDTGDVSVFRSPSYNSNGNTRDRQGRLISCEHKRRCISRTELDGRITVLMESFEGKRLNAPNDVVVHPDGHIWFTDPGYGILGQYEGDRAAAELPTRVYRLHPESGEASVVAEDMERPNGLCFSPDYARLYISDTGASHKSGHPRHIRVYEVDRGVGLKNGRVFCDMGSALSDGFRCDIDGNVWTSASWGGPEEDGVHVFTPEGELIAKIHVPEPVSNLCFGGLKKNRLFITAGQSLYSLYVEAQGIQYP